MLREERLQAMLRILSEQEFLTVEELSTRLMVSHPTIRRDLADLAQRRLIVRSHGGAMRAPDEKVTAPLDFRRSIHAREKSLISREAAKLIRNLSGNYRTIPIIAMTANAFDEDRQKALSVGMDAHLAKPVDVKRLFGTLRKVIR